MNINRLFLSTFTLTWLRSVCAGLFLYAFLGVTPGHAAVTVTDQSSGSGSSQQLAATATASDPLYDYVSANTSITVVANPAFFRYDSGSGYNYLSFVFGQTDWNSPFIGEITAGGTETDNVSDPHYEQGAVTASATLSFYSVNLHWAFQANPSVSGLVSDVYGDVFEIETHTLLDDISETPVDTSSITNYPMGYAFSFTSTTNSSNAVRRVHMPPMTLAFIGTNAPVFSLEPLVDGDRFFTVADQSPAEDYTSIDDYLNIDRGTPSDSLYVDHSIRTYPGQIGLIDRYFSWYGVYANELNTAGASDLRNSIDDFLSANGLTRSNNLSCIAGYLTTFDVEPAYPTYNTNNDAWDFASQIACQLGQPLSSIAVYRLSPSTNDCALIHIPILQPTNQSFWNVQFYNNQKVGPAAAGHSSTDQWNCFSHAYSTYATMSSLIKADGSSSSVSITVSNAPGAWGNSTGDPMFDSYAYPWNSGNVGITFGNIPDGTYDLYLYGHGAADDQNSTFTVASGGTDYGTQSTATGGVWHTAIPPWVLGQQYVVFRNVEISSSGLSITVAPNGGYATICGLQLIPVSILPR